MSCPYLCRKYIHIHIYQWVAHICAVSIYIHIYTSKWYSICQETATMTSHERLFVQQLVQTSNNENKAPQYHPFVRKTRQWAAITSLIARFVGPIWGLSGADRTQMGPMLAPWTLLSGTVMIKKYFNDDVFQRCNLWKRRHYWYFIIIYARLHYI